MNSRLKSPAADRVLIVRMDRDGNGRDRWMAGESFDRMVEHGTAANLAILLWTFVGLAGPLAATCGDDDDGDRAL